MNQQNAETERNEAGPAGAAQQGACCESTTAETTDKCPCCEFLKKHWLVGAAMFLVMLAMLIISQVGGILGIIAFIRTM